MLNSKSYVSFPVTSLILLRERDGCTYFTNNVLFSITFSGTIVNVLLFTLISLIVSTSFPNWNTPV